MREIKSLNKPNGPSKKHFFLEEGEKTIGHYKFDSNKEIGSGYSSKVYKAISTKDNLEYAIKTIELKTFKSSHFAMLQNQIKILKKMQHPNIIRFEDVYKTPTHLYIVTEFCEKGDLLTHMTRKGTFDEKQALTIFADILQGIKYLLKMQIIHRDLKPGNILSDGKKWKIADFGFAIESLEEIKTRNNVGTPLYMPLESLQKNIYSPESDLFAAGIILYELIVGITPWECRSEQELIKKLRNNPFRISSRVKVSEGTSVLLKKLCQKDVASRMTHQQFAQIDSECLKRLRNSVPLFQNLKQEEVQEIKPIKNNAKATVQRNDPYEAKQVNKKTKTNHVTTHKLKRSVVNESKQDGPSLIKIKSELNLGSKISDFSLNEEDSPIQRHMFLQNKLKIEYSNKSIMIWIINSCRFIYYLQKNANFLDINAMNRQKLQIVLFKHTIKILKQLADTKINYFNLHGWSLYKQTKVYHKLMISFNDYLSKYENQYLALTQTIEENVLRQINQKLPELSLLEKSPLGGEFYEKLQVFLAPILRENNHNLASQICGGKKSMKADTPQKIQGIKQFYKYCKLVKQFCKQNIDYQEIEKICDIELLKIYKDTKMTVQQFMVLRKEMKYI